MEKEKKKSKKAAAGAMQIVSANISQKLSAVHLGRALGELGFQRVKYHGQRGYIVVQRTAEEIEMNRRMLAGDALYEGDDETAGGAGGAT